MAEVFISYAREDGTRAEKIARGLQAMGLDCFWDTEIPPGQTWSDYIEGKLSACKAVIVLWSAHSIGSQWVREEARMGRDKGKLIPAMLDNSPVPFGFGEVQAANLATWTGAANHGEWVRFSNAVYAAARGSEVAPPPPQQAAPVNVTAPATPASPGAPIHSPIDYIAKCLRLYVNGAGRARRSEFSWFVFFTFVAVVIGAYIDLSMYGLNPYTGAANAALFTGIASLALICPFVAAASRRAHDFGQSGWLAALAAVPYVGIIASLVFIFIPSQAGYNKYGPNPKGV